MPRYIARRVWCSAAISVVPGISHADQTELTGPRAGDLLAVSLIEAGAAAQRDSFEQCSARFRIAMYEGGLDAKPLECIVDWWRDAALERVAVTPADVSSARKFMRCDVSDDGTLQTTFFPRSHQALVTPSRPLPVLPHPNDFFLPLRWLRLDRLPSDVIELAITSATESEIELAITFFDGGESIEAEIAVAPGLDYSVTRWASRKDGQFAAIEFERCDDGAVLPRAASVTLFADEAQSLVERTWTLEVLNFTPLPPPPGTFSIQLPPGTVVTDYTQNGPKNRPPLLSTVDLSGNLRHAVVVPDPHPVPMQSRAAAVAGAGMLVGVALLGRLKLAPRSRPQP